MNEIRSITEEPEELMQRLMRRKRVKIPEKLSLLRTKQEVPECVAFPESYQKRTGETAPDDE